MILNGKTINPSEMRTQVSLCSRAVAADAGGFQTLTWTTQATVWAKWTNAHGVEALEAQAAGAGLNARALIRYYAGLDTTWSVLKGAERWQIVSVDDIQERHEYMELLLRRVEAG